MDKFFGIFFFLGTCVSGSLLMTLLFYALAQLKRKEASSFFSLDFLWRLTLSEIFLTAIVFIVGMTFGGGGMMTDSVPLMFFFGLLGVVMACCLLVIHHEVIVLCHTAAARSRRLKKRRRMVAS